jgi:hypothetical protein
LRTIVSGDLPDGDLAPKKILGNVLVDSLANLQFFVHSSHQTQVDRIFALADLLEIVSREILSGRIHTGSAPQESES